ncbi:MULTISPECIES: MCE family protein [unclassified Mycobacterium]|uniref:MCE family protein n=1 Tax=unclassified Mycobacterium TaxID=2642494 RepID=UPI00073FE8DA|nr:MULTISPECIES: MCE family protein [unclassified Mycobacterium]KUH82864.1 mammalian cell entry protein [Mycobacterium sp. IS-1556]KUH83355.1 mammalian cell entry protein [Mycobacterium sp. GA-0227b]KUH84233.1 mammalian cell entry protein [Mycobacterium sp. GA-1999]
MLTPQIKRQLVVFAVLTVIGVIVLGWYYMHIPRLAGVGQYELKAELPSSGGLYATANVTSRGVTIGKVTNIEPTRRGAIATMSIGDQYKIPIDATANVHSVSAVGEQYIDLVSENSPDQYFAPGQTITKSTVPAAIGPALDAANRGLAALPEDKIASLLDETSQAVGGLGPALQRLVDSTQATVGDFKANIDAVNDIIAHSGPILDSQVNSADSIERWAARSNILARQAAETDQNLDSILSNAAPLADQLNAVFAGVGESLPQTLANLAIVLDMLKRYHANAEQLLVLLPQLTSIAQTATASGEDIVLDFAFSINQPPPCFTGFLPASEWRATADTSKAPLPAGMYCKIPKDTAANVVRGSRNIPCVDVPGKRAATPRECRSDEPYVPLGTNPWYGDPNQILSCPAPAARCDHPVEPGRVIPAPSVNTGLNPLPADLLPGTPPPVSDPLSPPGSGTVQCSGQQPNPCDYTPNTPPAATYNPSSGEVVAPNGVKYGVEHSTHTGDDGWKHMLAPAG